MAGHDEPCEDLTSAQSELIALRAELTELQITARRYSDPVSPRMLALVIVIGVIVSLIFCAYWKVLPGEAIAAAIGMIAGRLTSNIGGDTFKE